MTVTFRLQFFLGGRRRVLYLAHGLVWSMSSCVSLKAPPPPDFFAALPSSSWDAAEAAAELLPFSCCGAILAESETTSDCRRADSYVGIHNSPPSYVFSNDR